MRGSFMLQEGCNESTVSEKMGFSDVVSKHSRALQARLYSSPKKRFHQLGRLCRESSASWLEVP
jgi:hypothetical protein